MLTLQVIPSEWKRFDAMNLPLVTGFLRDRDTALVYNRIREAAWVFVSGRSDVWQWQKLDWPSRVRVTCLADIAITRVTVLTKSVTGSEEAGNEYRRKSTGEVVQPVPQWVRSGGPWHVTASSSPLCPMPWDVNIHLFHPTPKLINKAIHLCQQTNMYYYVRLASLIARSVKNLPAMQETPVWFPGSGRSPGEGKGYPLQYSWASLWLSW